MSEKSSVFLAHVRQDSNGQWVEHLLDEHLHGVAALAESFAVTFKAGDWARLAGLWHDLGKYRTAFQRYIRTVSGYEAHIEASSKVDHSTAGALYAIQRMKGLGRILAYLIAGHHAGLPDWQSAEAPVSSLANRLNQADLLADALAAAPLADIVNAPLPISNPGGERDHALWIRLLFSCLVDADFLDTEQFMTPDKTAQRGRYPTLAELEPRFAAYMTGLTAKTDATAVNRMRALVLERCRNAAEQSPGLFSLTVPTGGGKTLASLAFALRHARQHGKRRILYVIPYTSIIEQTADVFRTVFGADAVLEHHSNFETEQETSSSRLACENWDAPLIVTTSVQFFESLFANRSSRVRKVHNILDTVVILEADNVKTAMKRGKGTLGLYVEEDRQQRAALLLREVAYRLHARFELTAHAGPDDTPAKYAAIFRRRAEKGQCFNQPYLGCREFSAAFAWADTAESEPVPIPETRDLGWMLYDLEYGGTEPTPCFFRTQLDNGTLRIPAWDSEEIAR